MPQVSAKSALRHSCLCHANICALSTCIEADLHRKLSRTPAHVSSTTIRQTAADIWQMQQCRFVSPKQLQLARVVSILNDSWELLFSIASCYCADESYKQHDLQQFPWRPGSLGRSCDAIRSFLLSAHFTASGQLALGDCSPPLCANCRP